MRLQEDIEFVVDRGFLYNGKNLCICGLHRALDQQPLIEFPAFGIILGYWSEWRQWKREQ